MLLAKSQEQEYEDIFKSCFDVVSMGTPYYGTSGGSSMCSVYAAIAAAFPEDWIENSVIRTLNRGNDTLMDVVREFGILAGNNGAAKNMTLPCFYEIRKTKVGRIIGAELPKVAESYYAVAPNGGWYLTCSRNLWSMKRLALFSDERNIVWHSIISA